MGEYITINESLLIMVLAISVVFSILSLIALIVHSFKYVFKEENKTKKIENVKKENISINNNSGIEDAVKSEESIVASIVASIDANKNDEDKIYKIVSIKQL